MVVTSSMACAKGLLTPKSPMATDSEPQISAARRLLPVKKMLEGFRSRWST